MKFQWGSKKVAFPNPRLKNNSSNAWQLGENADKDKVYLFGALVLPLHGSERLEEGISKLFKPLLEKAVKSDPADFRFACMKDFAAVKDIDGAVIFLYDIDLAHVNMFGELASLILGRKLY